jgi:hypothetical protein
MAIAVDEIQLAIGSDRVSALVTTPTEPVAALVLAHGAGAGMRHPFLATIAAALGDRGIAVLRYQFPYMEAKKSRTDSPAVATLAVERATLAAHERWPNLPLVAGGKSFGGRMTSTAASTGRLPHVRGLVFFGFPLHPPKRPAATRADHLDQVSQPMLFLQGTRDDLADLELIREVIGRLGDRATLHVVPGADHSFAVLKSSGRTTADALAEVVETAAGWIGELASKTARV